MNDTVTEAGLMTVPISNIPNISLCYEVHGQSNRFFNLISDTCVAVNAHFTRVNTVSPNIDTNVMDAVGVRAVSENGTCVNIQVRLQGCSAAVDGQVVSTYEASGVKVSSDTNHVRITVPNCGDPDLTMWVFCSVGQIEDPVTWEYFQYNYLRFVVMHGINLDALSHGLIGKLARVFTLVNLLVIISVL